MRHIAWFARSHQPELRLVGRVLVITAVVLSLRAAAAYAGNDITFDELNDLVSNWTKGSLGKALALMALILGIGTAAARQSFGALFGGVGVAAAASIGPGVIDQVISALFSPRHRAETAKCSGPGGGP